MYRLDNRRAQGAGAERKRKIILKKKNQSNTGRKARETPTEEARIYFFNVIINYGLTF